MSKKLNIERMKKHNKCKASEIPNEIVLHDKYFEGEIDTYWAKLDEFEQQMREKHNGVGVLKLYQKAHWPEDQVVAKWIKEM